MIIPSETKEKTFLESIAYLEEIESKTPEEAHTLIVNVLYDQQKLIDGLSQDNKKLWNMVKTYEEKQVTSTQILAQKIWDNKDDEFWDTL